MIGDTCREGVSVIGRIGRGGALATEGLDQPEDAEHSWNTVFLIKL